MLSLFIIAIGTLAVVASVAVNFNSVFSGAEPSVSRDLLASRAFACD